MDNDSQSIYDIYISVDSATEVYNSDENYGYYLADVSNICGEFSFG